MKDSLRAPQKMVNKSRKIYKVEEYRTLKYNFHK